MYKMYLQYILMDLANDMSQSMNTKSQTFFTGGRSMRKTRKNINGRGAFLRGWKKAGPGYHDRTTMMKKCGRRCFLGPNKSFPICRRNTCKKDKRGIYAAYIRAREFETIKGLPKYKRISAKARRLIKIF
jgi:hypothetical protein